MNPKLQPSRDVEVLRVASQVLTIITDGPRAYVTDEPPPRPEPASDDDAHYGVTHERQNYQD